jgi:hypothetical protein
MVPPSRPFFLAADRFGPLLDRPPKAPIQEAIHLRDPTKPSIRAQSTGRDASLMKGHDFNSLP